jgi:hypothetical protein
MSIWRNITQFFSQLRARPPQPTRPEVDHGRGSGTPRVTFRATSAFLSGVRGELMRPHAFAYERVGFITVRAAQGADGLILLADNYYPVADEDYLPDPTVGAMIGQEALRKALELALLKGVGVFHVHMHEISHRLWFSATDLREQLKFIPDFFTVCPQMPHGAIVLNSKTAAGRVWLGPSHVTNISAFDAVGPRMIISRAAADGSTDFYA